MTEPAEKPRTGAQLILFLLVVVVFVGNALLFLNYKPKSSKANDSSPRFSGEIPPAPFKNITAEAGVRFQHETGAAGEKLLPETMGGGVAFFDFNNDGKPDLLFVNSGSLPGASGISTRTLTLYKNLGNGKFQDVSSESGLTASFYGMGVATADYDNDGWVDVFVTAVGENHLFRNDGSGHFTEVTAVAGVAGSGESWSTSAAWIDYDNDGKLDLFVCNYIKWSRAIDLEVNYQLPGIGRAYGPPMSFAGAFPYLYHNEGQGKFADVSATSGIQVKNPATGAALGKSLGVAPVDLDGDGWIDLIVANDTVQNFVFHNERNGTFKEMGARSGLAYDVWGATRGAMGIDTGRFQAGNTLGISIGNFANEMTALYVSKPDPLLFSDEAISEGIGDASRNALTFGVFFFDYDLDGWLDLLTVNGHIEPEIARVRPEQKYKQPAQLFWNTRGLGGNSFLAVPPEKCGTDLLEPIVGRGSAFADIDEDGDLDVVLTQAGGPAVLLRNGENLGHHWLRLNLVGTKSNRDAIGAWIRVSLGSQVFSQQVMPARGYLSQSEKTVTFGLGKATRVDEITITWPGGRTQKVGNVKIDALNTITEQ
jgi:hypothetical protein